MKETYKTYYVSSLKGNDSNDGLTKETPLYTLHKINSLFISKEINKVYIECGSEFNNQYIHLNNVSNIEIDSYGSGVKPKINANGQGIWYQDYGMELDNPAHVYRGYVSSAILCYDVSNISISNIEVTNVPTFRESYISDDKMDRTGISVIAQNKGTLKNITLKNIIVRNINGNVYNKHMNNGGICFTALKPLDEEGTGIAKYDGINIENCYMNNVSRWGISVGYTYNHQYFKGAILEDELFTKYGHENIVIKNNYIKNIGGDGITPMYSLNPVVESNISDTVAREINDEWYVYPNGRGGKVAAAIWPWKCKNAIFRKNQGLNTRLNQDGMPWDADSGDGTLYEHNFSRLNEGGCVMFCLEESVNNTFRYNVSCDDLLGTISPVNNLDAYIHDNIFYKRKSVPFIRNNMGGGDFKEENNKFIDI